MNDILIPDKFSLDGIEPYMLQVSSMNKPLLTIHADGRITVSEDLKPTETAAEVLKIMQDMWLSNQQVVKIKELQERIKRLEKWIACLNPIAQHSGQSENREWHGVDIGWLYPSQVVYLGEAKP